MKSSFPQRRPLLFVVLLLLVILVTYFLAGAITFNSSYHQLAMALMADGVLALIAIFLLSRLHWWREAGFRLPANPRSLWLFAVPCLPIILNMAFFGVGYPGIGRLLLFLAAALLVGFVEETLLPWDDTPSAAQARTLASRDHFLPLLWHPASAQCGWRRQSRCDAAAGRLCRGYWLDVCGPGLAHADHPALDCDAWLDGLFRFPRLEFDGCHYWPQHTVFLVTAGEIIIYTAYSIILMRQMKPQTRGADTGATFKPTPVTV